MTGWYRDHHKDDDRHDEECSGETIIGNDRGNVLTGTDCDDTILGMGGNDLIRGGDGDDYIDGGSGNDTIYGGDGNDTIIAGTGRDVIYGGNGNDFIVGGGDGDYLSGGSGADTFSIVPDGDGLLNYTTVDGGSTGDDNDSLYYGALLRDGYELAYHLKVPDLFNFFGPRSYNGTMKFYKPSTGQWQIINYFDIENIVPCFTPGSLIATPGGEIPVEHLRPGMKVMTRDNGVQEIAWAGQADLSASDLAARPQMAPVLITHGALGNGLPERDMMVSPNHRMLVTGDRAQLYFGEYEVLVAAKHLVGTPGVSSAATPGVSYIHFMFEHHEVVLSDGAWTESFQPGEQTMGSMGRSQREEIWALFPDLKSARGREAYRAARKTLKRHEAVLLR